MKRKIVHPEPSERSMIGPRYWRSLDELAATPGFKAAVDKEFPEGASEMDGVDRRHFMKIMAASFALGGIGLNRARGDERFILVQKRGGGSGRQHIPVTAQASQNCKSGIGATGMPPSSRSLRCGRGDYALSA